MSAVHPWLRFIASLLLLAPWCAAQQRPGLEQARERWHQMSPEERARIAKRFEEYRGLSESERQRLASHLERVAEVRREIEAAIPAQARATLERLDPARRREVLREYVEAVMAQRAERLRGKLAPEFVEKLQGAGAAERETMLCAGRDEWRERWAPKLLAKLARELQLPPEEAERLQSLTHAERMAAIEELSRRAIELRGPPPGVDPEQFREWLELPSRELMERIHRQGMRGTRGRDGGEGPGERGPRPPRRESRLEPETQAQVLGALRREPEWILELAEEPREARQQEIGRRVRVRVLEILRREPAVTAEELGSLEASSGKEFQETLRGIVGDPPRMAERGRWGPRGGGPDGPPGEGDGSRKRRERHRDEPPRQP